jgi:hypothetical protein
MRIQVYISRKKFACRANAELDVRPRRMALPELLVL